MFTSPNLGSTIQATAAEAEEEEEETTTLRQAAPAARPPASSAADPSAAERSPQPFAAPGSAGPQPAPPPPPGTERGKKECLRPPAPRLPAAPAPPATRRGETPARGSRGRRCDLFIYFQSKMSEPEPPVGWKALSLWRPIAGGRERASEQGGPGTAPRRNLTHTEPQHRLYSAAAGWG